MLYNRNTNQVQSLQDSAGGRISRGPRPKVAFIDSIFTTTTSSLFVSTDDGTILLSTTSSASTSSLVGSGSFISASVAGIGTPSADYLVALSVTSNDLSFTFNGTSTGSAISTSFVAGDNVYYTIDSEVTYLPFPGNTAWFWGDISSYDSGSGIWVDKSGNGNDATVYGDDLIQTGSLGLIFNGINNYLGWASGGFSTASCVSESFTIQITMQPDYSITTNPWNTTALFHNGAGGGTTGLMNLYLNDGLNPSNIPSQGASFSPARNNRDNYIYGANSSDAGFFSSSVQTVTWRFYPATSDVEKPYEYQYYIYSYGEEQYTNAGNIFFENNQTPTATFGIPVYTTTGTEGNGQNLTYNYYKGIVRDIVIYKSKLTEFEIYRNAGILNNP